LLIVAHAETANLKVSQGLNHTMSLAILAWKELFNHLNLKVEDRKAGIINDDKVAAVLLPGYFIFCNDTDQDLILGQVRI